MNPGSTLLTPLADVLDLPVEQVNIISGQIVAVLLGLLYRRFLSPKNSSTVVRHVVSSVLGLWLGYFCFGNTILHLIIHASLCYLATIVIPAAWVHLAVFVLAMGYLVVIHIERAYNGVFAYGIEGPLMMSTVKVTVVAFGLHDGSQRNNNDIPEENKKHCLTKVPSVIEYASYILHFQTAIAGPVSFYSDYISFVEGRNFTIEKYNENGNCSLNKPYKEPSPTIPVIQKFALSVLWMILYMILNPMYPIVSVSEASFVRSNGLLYTVYYFIICTYIARFKYYLVWTIGETACNAAGYGYNGVGENGKPKWDLLTSVHPWKLHKCTNVKAFVDSWNIPCSKWLRYMCYTRVKFMQTLCTFTLSALWHGCYPGYFACFIGCALGITAGRKIRRTIRPLFQSNHWMSTFYDILTWFCTLMFLGYVGVPFHTLNLASVIQFYWNFYWSIHLILILIIVSPVPSFLKQKEPSYTSKVKGSTVMNHTKSG